MVFLDDNNRSRTKWRRLLPHAKYTLSYWLTEQEDKDRTNLAWKCVLTLYSNGRYNELEELFMRVMETHKTKLGANNSDTSKSRKNSFIGLFNCHCIVVLYYRSANIMRLKEPEYADYTLSRRFSARSRA